MNEILYEKSLELKKEISILPEVIELERLNKLLNESEEVMRLCYRKDSCLIKYEDALKYFGEKSKEVEMAQKELHKAKLSLDEHILVKQYNEQYKKVRKIYDYINTELFGFLN